MSILPGFIERGEDVIQIFLNKKTSYIIDKLIRI